MNVIENNINLLLLWFCVMFFSSSLRHKGSRQIGKIIYECLTLRKSMQTAESVIVYSTYLLSFIDFLVLFLQELLIHRNLDIYYIQVNMLNHQKLKKKLSDAIVGINRFILIVEIFMKQLKPFFPLHRHLFLPYFSFITHTVLLHLPFSMKDRWSKIPSRIQTFLYLALTLVTVQSQIQKLQLLFKHGVFHVRS